MSMRFKELFRENDDGSFTVLKDTTIMVGQNGITMAEGHTFFTTSGILDFSFQDNVGKDMEIDVAEDGKVIVKWFKDWNEL